MPLRWHPTWETNLCDRLIASPGPGRGGVQEIARRLVSTAREFSPQKRATLASGARELIGARTMQAEVRHALTWKTALLLNAPKGADDLIVWAHGADLDRDHYPWSMLRHRMLTSAKGLACATPYAKDLLDRWDVPSAMIGPPVNFPPLGEVPCGRPTNWDAVRLLSLGRFDPRKGHDTAILVAVLLREQGLEVELDVIGQGPDLARLKTMAQDLPFVKVHNDVSNEERDQFFSAADLLLFLPRTEGGEREGLGMVTLEAAAYGVPAVVGECGGSVFGLLDGETGLLCPAAVSASDIAAQVTAALERRATLSSGARSFAEQFSISSWWTRVTGLESGCIVPWQWPTR